MKKTFILLVFVIAGMSIQAQENIIAQTESYCSHIDSLRNKRLLDNYFYPNMSLCGGAVHGFYQNDKLVFINALHGAEFGYISRQYYFRDTVLVKITEDRYLPADTLNWDKFCMNHKTSIGDCDYRLIPYDQTLTKIYFSDEPLVIQTKNTQKIASPDSVMTNELIHCNYVIKKELCTQKVKE
jgi:hypothetical protein